VTEGVPSKRRQANDRSPIENALRYIANQRTGMPLDQLLRSALAGPTAGAGPHLRPLIEPTEVLETWTESEKAAALEQLIIEGVEHPSVGPGERSRERRVLRAALRLPDPDIRDEWAGTLEARWNQLRVLTTLFPHPSTRQPMDAAWARGVERLAGYLGRAFREEVRQLSDWRRLKEERLGEVEEEESVKHHQAFRKASEDAQPFFVDRFVTTVFMKGRALSRRITERVVTARRDEVSFYIARTYSGGRTSGPAYVPVRALWGCRAEPIPVSRMGEPVVTRLWFPQPLTLGQQASFASEALFNGEPSEGDDRDSIDVEIDHHGIAQGSLYFGETFPIGGLTIRVVFEPDCLPVQVWWYAETTYLGRLVEPTAEDGRLLTISECEVTHTFTDMVCQPRESYGIAFRWPSES
jgi:hypothetical protein